MAKGYWIGHVDVFDADVHRAYVPLSTAAILAFDGRFLVRGGEAETVEGQTRNRHIVVEFPSLDAARACYRSPAYAAALAVRANSAVADIVIVEGA